jgi:Mrp family chromosome partitioning ATPase
MGKVYEILKRREASPEPPSAEGQPTSGRGRQTAGRETASNRLSPEDPAAAAPSVELEHMEERSDVPFYEIPEVPAAQPPADSGGVASSPAVASSGITFEPWSRLDFQPPAAAAPELVVWREPQSSTANHYRQLCAAIAPMLAADQLRSLLLLPVERDRQSALVMVNVALALGEKRQQPLLLIDADPQDGQIAQLLGLAAAPGWTELLSGLPLRQVIQDSSWRQLHVIAAGNRLACANPLRWGEHVRARLAHLGRRYELIVVRSPGWRDSAAAAILAHGCNAACLLLTRAQVGQPFEAACLDSLRKDGVRVLGSIILGENR